MKAKKQAFLPQFDREACVACTTCVYDCPTGAIELEVRNSVTGFRRFPVLSDAKRCSGCRLCESNCPVYAISA